MVLSGCSPIKRYTSEAGSVESMTISVLKVGSYYRNNRLSFKGFQVPKEPGRNVNIEAK